MIYWNKDFGRIQWNRLEPMEVGGLQSRNRVQAAGIKAVSDGF
jgi:hypothetical protein